MIKTIKFALFADELYKQLSMREQEYYQRIVLTKVKLIDSGTIEIEGMCVPDEGYEVEPFRRKIEL